LVPRGTPGAKSIPKPLFLPVPYMSMDESRLLAKNWMAFLDNKHVAEVAWTRSRIGGQEKTLRQLQQSGQAWHYPINTEATTRW